MDFTFNVVSVKFLGQIFLEFSGNFPSLFLEKKNCLYLRIVLTEVLSQDKVVLRLWYNIVQYSIDI